MGFVYKYVNVDKDEIIYIGKTKNLNARIMAHGIPGDNIDEMYWDEINKCDVFVMAIDGDLATDFMETVLINKYKPKCNKGKYIFNYAELGVEYHDHDEYWVKYEENHFHISSGYQTNASYKRMQKELVDARQKYKELLNRYNDLRDKYELLTVDDAASRVMASTSSATGRDGSYIFLNREGYRHQVTIDLENIMRDIEMELYGARPNSDIEVWQIEGGKKCFHRLVKQTREMMGIEYLVLNDNKW